jgi:very-short-patch-repair endonuclease
MVLVRSVQEDQLNPNDLKARVIRHFHDPMAGAETPSGDLEEKCDSDFERNVLRRLIKRGYRVRPQVGALGFRIDLVVEGENDKRLAIELDGDKYHGPERWADDMRRQRVLERVGWRFWRCWASSFTLDPEACMADLLATLERAGIQPIGTDSVGSKYTEHRIAVPSQPEPVRYDVEETGGIGVGDRLTIRYLDTNKTATFRLTQERTDELNGLLGVTSPLGAQVLGAQADDELEFDAGDVKRTVLIVAVEPRRTRESPAQEEALVDA